MEAEGTAQEAASQWAQRIESRFPRDFVDRIRTGYTSLEKRDPRPGTVDHWMEER